MTVKELIELLKKYPQDTKYLMISVFQSKSMGLKTAV